MTDLNAYGSSLRLVAVIKKIAREEIEALRPKPKYAIVKAIDRTARKCTVSYVGETSEVLVNMGSVQPAAIGQRVRIEGVSSDRFISDVIGPVHDTTTGTWIDLPLLNLWTRDTTNVNSEPGYRKDGDVVRVRGLIRSGWTNDATVVAVLPEGYRPVKQVILPLATQTVSTFVRIQPTGWITLGPNIPQGNWVSLESISFAVG